MADSVFDPRGDRPECWAAPRYGLLLGAVLIMLLRLGPTWLDGYRPGNDEAWLLQAGWRLAHGQGLTCFMADDWSDLAEPRTEPMTYWPPGWAWTFAGLLCLGLDWPAALTALKALTALVVVAGAYGWLRLGARVLPLPGQLLFGLLLAGVWFADGQDAGIMHLIAWGIVPGIITALLEGCRRGTTTPLLMAGALMALAIVFRFHLGYFIPAAGLAVLILDCGGQPRSAHGGWWGVWRRRLLRASLAPAIGIVAMLGVLGYYKIIQQGHASWLTDTNALRNPWQLTNLLHREGLTFWFAFGLGLEDAVAKIKPSSADWPFAVFAGWYALLGGLAVMAARLARARGSLGGARGELAVMVACLAGGLVVLLAVTSLRGEPAPNWRPLSATRLYSELLPAVGLVWVCLLAAATASVVTPVGRAVVVAVTVVAIGLGGRPLVRELRLGLQRLGAVGQRGWGADIPVIAAVRRAVAEAPVPDRIVFDAHYDSVAALRVAEVTRAERLVSPELLARSGTSRPVYVVVVVRWIRPDGSDWATQHGLAYAKYFGLVSQGRLADAPTIELYTGVVPPHTPYGLNMVMR